MLWMLPFIPDIRMYNSLKVLPYQPSLTYLQEEEANWSQQCFARNLEELVSKLAKFDLYVLDMKREHPSLTEEAGSDGLHLGRHDRKKIAREVVRLAIKQLPLRKPRSVNNLRTIQGRRQRQNHHKRAKLRKAAERLAREHSAMLRAGAGPEAMQQAGAGPSGEPRRRSVVVVPEE